VGALLTNGAPGDVINRFATANRMATAQHETLDRYVAARMTAKDALNTSNAAVDAATKAQDTAAAALVASEHSKAQAVSAQASVTALIASRKAALAVAMKHKTSMLKQYQQLQAQEKSVEASLAKQAAADKKAAAKKAKTTTKTTTKTKSAPYTGGRQGYDIMPVHGWKSSNFGMRFDPIYKRWQLHAGVDIAVGTGTAIHAARAGRVIRAGWDGGYGNYTCVDTGLYEGSGTDHGKDIVNCYAHQSRILVHVGEHVSLGQTIGLVGMTGAATGPHLHFEVRVDGTPVQPLNWLPKCFC
jgi:murein DD-endopeptidase MepM/ murein hydrolase activator NlpD